MTKKARGEKGDNENRKGRRGVWGEKGYNKNRKGRRGERRKEWKQQLTGRCGGVEKVEGGDSTRE